MFHNKFILMQGSHLHKIICSSFCHSKNLILQQQNANFGTGKKVFVPVFTQAETVFTII